MALQPFDTEDQASSFGRAVGEVGGNIFNRTLGRLQGAKLPRGAEGGGKINSSAKWNTRTTQTDWRVKLTLPTQGQLRGVFFGGDDYYGLGNSNSLLEPLAKFNGIVFPLTPTVLINHMASYNPMAMTHSNYPFYSYGHSEVSAISIIGDFPVQNSEDARHWVATLHFLRAVTKMFFGGENDTLKGNPPPILKLNGYGNHVFNNVPVVVTNFTVDLRNQVDYISTEQSNRSRQGIGFDDILTNPAKNATWAPTDSQFNVQLQPVYSRESITKFSMRQFVNGSLSNINNTSGRNDGIGFI